MFTAIEGSPGLVARVLAGLGNGEFFVAFQPIVHVQKCIDLPHRYRHLSGHGKLPVQVCTAIARELTGFIWAVGQPAEVRRP